MAHEMLACRPSGLKSAAKQAALVNGQGTAFKPAQLVPPARRTAARLRVQAHQRTRVVGHAFIAAAEPSGSEDEASFFIRNLRALPWQRTAVWLVFVTAACQLRDFFGVRICALLPCVSLASFCIDIAQHGGSPHVPSSSCGRLCPYLGKRFAIRTAH